MARSPGERERDAEATATMAISTPTTALGACQSITRRSSVGDISLASPTTLTNATSSNAPLSVPF